VVRVKPYVHSWHTGHQPRARLWTKKSCTLTFRARVPLAGYAASSMLCQACCRRSRECPCSAVGSAYRLLTTISDYFGEIYFFGLTLGRPAPLRLATGRVGRRRASCPAALDVAARLYPRPTRRSAPTGQAAGCTGRPPSQGWLAAGSAHGRRRRAAPRAPRCPAARAPECRNLVRVFAE
jgi:hypothetical protein